jgi:hypothetical protein
VRNLKTAGVVKLALAGFGVLMPLLANVSAFTCTTFSYGDPSWPVTTTGINARKQIVGYAIDAQGRPHGFLRNADGTILSIDDPATGLAGTYPRAINNLGQVVGNYYLPDGPHGFLRDADGTVTEIPLPPPPSEPGSEVRITLFEVTGINDNGVISGVYNAIFGSGSTFFPDKYFYVFTRDPNGTYQTVDAKYNSIDNQGPVAARVNNAQYVLEVGGINWDAYLLSPTGVSTAVTFPGIPGYSHLGRQFLYANTVAFTNGATLNDIWSAGTFIPVNSGYIRNPAGNIQGVICPDDVQANVAVTGISDVSAVSGTLTSPSAPVQQGLLAEPNASTASLHVSNDWWDFQTSVIGQPSSHPARIYLTNPSETDLHIQAIYFGNTVESAPSQPHVTPYAITDTNCAAPTGNPAFPFAKQKLRSGDWCYINSNYTPTLGGSQPGQLIIIDDTPQSPHIVQLSGSGIAAKLQYSNTSWDFGVQPIGHTTGEGIIYIYNPTPAPVIFQSISATSSVDFPIPEFIAYEGTCSTLQPYTTCNIRFVFTPSTGGERYGAIHLVSNADPTDMVIPLQGWGQ